MTTLVPNRLLPTRTDALARLTQAVETATTLDELLLLAQSEVTPLFDVAISSVVLLGDDGSAQIASEFPPHAHKPAPFSLRFNSIAGRVAAERVTLPWPDGQASTTDEPFDCYLRDRGVCSALLVPLVAQDTVLGMLVLGATGTTRSFGDEESTFARALLGQLSAAIVAFRLREAATMRAAELATLNEIASAVTSTLDTREIYREIVQRLNTYFKVDAGSILLLDDATGELEFVVTIEGEKEVLVGKRVPRGQGVVGYVAASGSGVIVPDAQNDPRFYPKISEDVGYVTRSILCVPIVAKGTVIGVIELLNKLDGPFTGDDSERLARMAAFIGVALENARLFQKVADGRDQLAAILNSTADGMLMTDLVGTVVSANERAMHLFSDAGELIGQPLGTLLQQLHARAHDVVTKPWGDAPQSELPTSVTEYALSGQHWRFVRYLALPVHDAHGKIYGRLAVFRDITHEKELEQLRDDYTNMLIHDLRAPLTSVMNGITMTQRGLGGPVTQQQHDLLGIAQSGSQTMLELVNNLLDISRMELGQMHLNLAPLAPYAVLDAATNRLEASARTRHITIEQRLALDLPMFEADRDIIVRVLQNLIDNALKFSPQHSTVVTGAARFSPPDMDPALPVHPPLAHGTWIVFWVQDTGVGVPAAYHERIFEKFGQVQGRKGRGTGLGLTFSKLGVEAHGGRIWIESEHSGSIFAFALPVDG